MTGHASGTFEVKLTPQKADNPEKEAAGLGRMSIEKRLTGGLEGSGKGEMLSFLADVKGSGVYVAIERFTGTLDGRGGSFVLHHTGLAERGSQQLTIGVVPDSGSGELAGLSGVFHIRIEGGKHFYEFDYDLPNA